MLSLDVVPELETEKKYQRQQKGALSFILETASFLYKNTFIFAAVRPLQLPFFIIWILLRCHSPPLLA